MNGKAQDPLIRVPWICMKEWYHVHDLLFTNSMSKMSKGLNFLRSWISRGNCPIPIQSTYDILSIRYQRKKFIKNLESLKDQKLSVSSPSPSDSISPNDPPSFLLDRHIDDHYYKMSLGMAIIRMVNMVCDSGQQGATAISITKIAEQFGLDRILVDLRHDATHGQMPSIEYLEIGARLALKYWRKVYWKPTLRTEELLQETIQGKLKEILESRNKFLSDNGKKIDTFPWLRTIDSILADLDHLAVSPEMQRKLVEILFEKKDIYSKIIPDIATCFLNSSVSKKMFSLVFSRKLFQIDRVRDYLDLFILCIKNFENTLYIKRILNYLSEDYTKTFDKTLSCLLLDNVSFKITGRTRNILQIYADRKINEMGKGKGENFESDPEPISCQSYILDPDPFEGDNFKHYIQLYIPDEKCQLGNSSKRKNRNGNETSINSDSGFSTETSFREGESIENSKKKRAKRMSKYVEYENEKVLVFDSDIEVDDPNRLDTIQTIFCTSSSEEFEE